jgi:hypothetical protein
MNASRWKINTVVLTRKRDVPVVRAHDQLLHILKTPGKAWKRAPPLSGCHTGPIEASPRTF